MDNCKKGKIDELLKYEGLFELISNHFDVIERIGSGTFSSVYLASLKCDTKQLVALKHVIPTSHPSRTENELQCLKTIGGKKNVVNLLTALRHFDNIIIAMDYMPHDHFHDYVSDMELKEIQLYIKNLLIALEHVHSFNLIHRDIKPSNFLYDRKNKKFCLVDFGLAQKVDLNHFHSVDNISNDMMQNLNSSKSHQIIGKENINDDDKKKYASGHHKFLKSCNCYGHPSVCRICLCRPPQIASRAGTAGYRAPEVLLKIPNQSTVIDMWSAGVIYMSLLSGTHTIFKPTDDFGSLCQIISLFGSKEMVNMAKKYGKLLTCSAHYDAIPLKNVSRFLRLSRKCKKIYNSNSLFNHTEDDKKVIENEQVKINKDSSPSKNNIRTIESLEKYHIVSDDIKEENKFIKINEDCVNLWNETKTKIINNPYNYSNSNDVRINDYLDKYSSKNMKLNRENDILDKDFLTQNTCIEDDALLNDSIIDTHLINDNLSVNKIIDNQIVYDGVIITDSSKPRFYECLNNELLNDDCFTNDTIIAGNLLDSSKIKEDFIKPLEQNEHSIIRTNINKENLKMDYSDNINMNIIDLAYDLLERLLDIDPTSRWTATQSLHHPFFAQSF